MRQVGGRRVWAVTDVTRRLAEKFEEMEIPQLSVEGEITNLRPPSGSQVWFTLSDEHEIGCAMKAVAWERLRTRPRDGDRVIVRGDLQYWPQRNTITFWAAAIEPAGRGFLLAQIEELRGRLRRDGLIPGRGRPVPVAPRRIALVTSKGAAAYTDATRVIAERWPAAEVSMHDTPVQGDTAPPAIVDALAAAGREPGVEVILLVRGGGSLEDLMAFNDERVCRAIAASPRPVVTGIGHERDAVLADEVADWSRPTPTAAAVAVTPDAAAMLAGLDSTQERMRAALLRRRARAADGLAGARADLTRLLRERGRVERVDLAARATRLGNALAAPVLAARGRLADHHRRMPVALSRRAERAVAARSARAARLDAAMSSARAGGSARLDRLQGMLAALSPRATLSRGYAIVRDADGRIRPERGVLVDGDLLEVEFRDARVGVRVEEDG